MWFGEMLFKTKLSQVTLNSIWQLGSQAYFAQVLDTNSHVIALSTTKAECPQVGKAELQSIYM